MTTSLAQLEAALHISFDPPTLAVYADALQAAGDPRGEIIALEIALANEWTLAQYDRHHRCVLAWLRKVPCPGDGRWRPSQFAHGLLRTAVFHNPDELEVLLAGPVGRYVRELCIVGLSEFIDEMIGIMAAHALPWLRHLAIARLGGERPITDRQWAALAAVAPQLRELTLRGPGIVASPGPPAIRSVVLGRGDCLVVGSQPMRSITALGIEQGADYESGRADARLAAVFRILDARRFPALRTLDLSRTWNLLPALLTIGNPNRIERILLPQLFEADAALASAMVAKFRRARLQIARPTHATATKLDHPKIEPAVPYPWDWPDRPCDLAITIGDQRHELQLDIPELERSWPEHPPYVRDAWVAVLAALPRLGGEPVGIDAITLRIALGSVDHEHEFRIATALRRVGRAAVKVTRFVPRPSETY
jgi:hypothetical protein